VRLAGPWVRIHQTEHDPLFFGATGRNRFDDPLGRFEVLYAAQAEAGAFIEVFGFGVVGGVNTVRESELLAQAYASIEVTRPMRLVDLTGPGLVRIGATNALTAGAHQASQQWSRALWSHPSRPDGLLYRARYDPSCLSVALFDRVRRHVRVRPLGGLFAPENQALLAQILDRYAFSLRMDVTY
jgi:RES domain